MQSAEQVSHVTERERLAQEAGARIPGPPIETRIM